MNFESKLEFLKRLESMHGEYPSLNELYVRLERLRCMGRAWNTSPQHALLVGESGIGKTYAVMQYAHNSTIRQEQEIDEECPLSVLYVQAPDVFTQRELYQSVMRALGVPNSPSRLSLPDIRLKTFELIKVRRVEMILFDDAHHILLSKERPCVVMETLLELSNIANVSTVFVGPLEIQILVEDDTRYGRTFSIIELKKFEDWKGEFLSYLRSLEMAIGPAPISLSNPNTGLPQLLYYLSDGLPRVVTSLVLVAYRNLLQKHSLQQITSDNFVKAINCAKMSGDSDEGLTLS